jgi:hypothetical protein
VVLVSRGACRLDKSGARTDPPQYISFGQHLQGTTAALRTDTRPIAPSVGVNGWGKLFNYA